MSDVGAIQNESAEVQFSFTLTLLPVEADDDDAAAAAAAYGWLAMSRIAANKVEKKRRRTCTLAVKVFTFNAMFANSQQATVGELSSG